MSTSTTPAPPARRPTAYGDLGPAVVLAMGLVVLALLLVLAPLGGLRARDGFVQLLWWLVLAYCIVRIGRLAHRNTRRWSELCFWAFCYVWLGLAGMAQYLSDENPLWTHIGDELARTQALVILAGFVAFDVAGVLYRRWPRSGTAERRPVRWITMRSACGLSVVALLLTPLFVYVSGGLPVLFSNRQDLYQHLVDQGLYSDNGNAVGGLIRTFSNAVPYVALISLLALVAADRRWLREVRVVLALVVVVAINVVLNNPISNARYWFLAFVIGIGLHVAGRWRGRIVPALVAGYIGMASVAFPYLDAFRADGWSNAVRAPYEFFTGKTDYGAVTDIGLTIRLTMHDGFTGGRQILGALLFWVPRSLWPDKPHNTGWLISVDTNFPNRNLDSPLWAEGYVDYGLIGVLLLLGVAGLLCRLVDTGYLRALREPAGDRVPMMQVLGPTVAGYLAIIVRGSLLQAMAGIVVLVGLFWLVSRRAPGPLPPLPEG
jgi:hypothetical protein